MSDSSTSPTPAPGAPHRGTLPPPRGEKTPPRQHAEAEKAVYSLDDMMSRLRSSGSGSGREGDGEGRRRRRRSSQSGSGSSRRSGGGGGKRDRSRDLLAPSAGLSPRVKFWSVVAVAILVTLAGAIYGFRALTKFRVEGETFRVNVGRRVSEIIGRRAEFGKFTSGAINDLFSPSATFEMNGDDLLDTARFTDLTAAFSGPSWMTNEWNLSSVFARQGKLTFDPAPRDESIKEAWRIGAPQADRAAPTRGFRFGISADPAVIAVERARFESLDLEWPGPDGKPMGVYGLQGSMSLVPGTGMEGHASGGELRSGLWPNANFVVSHLGVRQSDTRLDINSRVTLGGTSEVRLTGAADLVPDGSIELAAEMPNPVGLKELISPVWEKTLSGDIRFVNATWTSHFRGGPPPVFQGDFRIDMLILRTGFAHKLASALRNHKLSPLEFNGAATGSFVWTPERTVVTGFQVAAGNLIRLSGDFEIDGATHALSGTMALDVDETFFTGLPGGRPAFFPEPVDGRSVVAFTIAGEPGNVLDSIPYEAGPIIEWDPRAAAGSGQIAPGAGEVPSPRSSIPGAPPTGGSANPTDAELEKAFNELTGRDGDATFKAPDIPSLEPPPAHETSKEDIERAIRRALR